MTVPVSARVPALVSGLAAGRYRLEVIVTTRPTVRLLGASVTRSVAVVDIDAAGDAVQRTTSIETRGRGYLARPLADAYAAMAPQRYRFEVDAGGVVTAAPGPLSLTLKMEIVVTAVGRFVVDVESFGHSRYEGLLTAAGAAGDVVVIEQRQRVLSGLPVKLRETTVVDTATFTLTRDEP